MLLYAADTEAPPQPNTSPRRPRSLYCRLPQHLVPTTAAPIPLWPAFYQTQAGRQAGRQAGSQADRLSADQLHTLGSGQCRGILRTQQTSGTFQGTELLRSRGAQANSCTVAVIRVSTRNQHFAAKDVCCSSLKLRQVRCICKSTIQTRHGAKSPKPSVQLLQCGGKFCPGR